jgi:hypothetical protein
MGSVLVRGPHDTYVILGYRIHRPRQPKQATMMGIHRLQRGDVFTNLQTRFGWAPSTYHRSFHAPRSSVRGTSTS